MKYLHTFLVALTAMSVSAFTLAGHHEKGEAMEAAHDAMETVEAAEDAMEEMGAAVEQVMEEAPKSMEY